jgi:uncharacterized protein YcaQ
VDRVRNEIEARGPLSSLDLEDDTRMDWWLAGRVRVVRIAMDILFYSGETVVHHRAGTRRYFELSQRVLPPQIWLLCVPVLCGDRLVARVDPEFNRASKVFTIKNWWWENGAKVRDESLLSALEECLSAFGYYLKAAEIRLGAEVRGQSGLQKAVKEANRGLNN